MNFFLSPAHWQSLLFSPSTIFFFLSHDFLCFLLITMFYSSVTTVYTHYVPFTNLIILHWSLRIQEGSDVGSTTPNKRIRIRAIIQLIAHTPYKRVNHVYIRTYKYTGNCCVRFRLCPMRHQRNPWTRPPPSPGMPKIRLGLSDGEMRSCIRTQASSQAQIVPAKPSKSEYGWSGVLYADNCPSGEDIGGSAHAWSRKAIARDSAFSPSGELTKRSWDVKMGRAVLKNDSYPWRAWDCKSQGQAFPLIPWQSPSPLITSPSFQIASLADCSASSHSLFHA